MDVLPWLIAAGAVVVMAVVLVVTVRRTRTQGGQPVRSPIVIQLPPESRIRLTRDRLSYTLKVDDSIEIRGLSVTQVAVVVRSFVDAHVPMRFLSSRTSGELDEELPFDA